MSVTGSTKVENCNVLLHLASTSDFWISEFLNDVCWFHFRVYCFLFAFAVWFFCFNFVFDNCLPLQFAVNLKLLAVYILLIAKCSLLFSENFLLIADFYLLIAACCFLFSFAVCFFCLSFLSALMFVVPAILLLLFIDCWFLLPFV